MFFAFDRTQISFLLLATSIQPMFSHKNEFNYNKVLTTIEKEIENEMKIQHKVSMYLHRK